MLNLVVDGLFVRDKVLHSLDLFGSVANPTQMLADDPEPVSGAIGFCWIARKLFVSHVGVVHKRAGRFDDVDPLTARPPCQFRSPSSRVQRLAKVDPGRFPLRVVRRIPTRKFAPDLKLRLGAMIKRPPADVGV